MNYGDAILKNNNNQDFDQNIIEDFERSYTSSTDEEENYSNKIIKSTKIFDTNYLPQKLRHRGKEINKLGEYFSPLEKGENPKDLSIYGKTGTGKSAVIKYVLNLLETKFDREDRFLVYVNCKSNDSATQIFSKIARKISKKDLPKSGLGASVYLEEAIERLEETGSVLIVVLDEVDYLLEKREDLEMVLYNLTDENDITTIMISNNASWKEEIKDTRIMSRMGAKKMNFSAYSKDQLLDILKDRVREGLKEGSWDEEILKYISERASDEYGDARIGIKLVYESASEAQDSFEEKISKDHVDVALEILEKNNVLDYISTLSAQQKILTIALARKYQKTNYIATSSLYKEYKNIAKGSEKYRCVGKSMIYRYLKELQVYGIIERKKSQKESSGRGRKEMIIKPKFNPKELLKEVEKGNI